MSRQIILNGDIANDGTGDNLRVTADKINNNFLELYGAIHVQPNGDVIIKSNNNTGTVYIGDPTANHITVPNKDIGEPITIGKPDQPVITVPTVPTDPITINSPVNPVVIGDPGCANLTVPQCSSHDPVQLTSPTTPIQIGDPQNPAITVPPPGSTDPITIGDPGNGSGPNDNNSIQVPNPGTSGPINIGDPQNPAITIPDPSTGDPITIGNGNQKADINLNLQSNRVVYTNSQSKLEVDDSLQFASDTKHMTVNQKDMYIQLGTFGGAQGESTGDSSYAIIWKGEGEIGNSATKHYGYIKGQYGNQDMSSESSFVSIAGGTYLTGLDGYSGNKNELIVSYSGHVSIATDPGTYNENNHMFTIGRGGMLHESYAAHAEGETKNEQIFHAWGTSQGDQIYQVEGGYKLGQLGNQGKTYWLGHGGEYLDPLAVGERCITWDTDCKVTIGDPGKGIVVPPPGSGDPITIGDGFKVPTDGSGGPSLGNPGTGLPPGGGGGSGGPNGGPTNPGGTPGVSVPAPWNGNDGPNPESPLKIKNPDGPIDIGTPETGGPGIEVPTPGSGDPLKVVTNLTPNRVVWTLPEDGTLGVSDNFKYDDTTLEINADVQLDKLEVSKFVKTDADKKLVSADVDWSDIQNIPDSDVTVTLAGNLTGTGTGTMTDLGDVTVTITGGYKDTFATPANTSTSVTPDRDNGTVHKFTATDSFTLNTPTNMVAGQNLTLIITQDATGGRIMTADALYKFASGFKTLSTSANAVDMLNIFYDGTYYYVTLTVGYA